MTTLTRNEAARFLLEQDRILILTHTRPDGDTTGSAAALCHGLRQLGKQAWVLENRELTERFAWLHAGLTKQAAEEADVLVSVDVASPGMLPEPFRPLLERIELRLDHHASATSFARRELVDPGSASCAELVWDVLMEMGAAPAPALAEAVYVGLSTDTGCFRYANTTAHTFQTAAWCAQAGARIFQLNQVLFETNTLGRLKIQAWIVDHLQLLQDGAMAICAIPKAVERELAVTEDDMDNISSFPRTVAGVCMAATLREAGKGVKLSVRAVPGFDATEITAAFGGGGHKGAAGAFLPMSLEQARQAVEQAMTARPCPCPKEGAKGLWTEL